MSSEGVSDKALYLDGKAIHKYEIIEPKSQPSNFLSAASPFASHHSGFGSGFGSGRSISSRISQRLATAQPTLQSSWVNVATPIPVGASHLALHQGNVDEFRSSDAIEKEQTAPPDRWSLVYIIFIIHGVGTLLPWNMFLTANSYFTEFKLAPSANETESEYAKNFLSYLGITAQLPNLILNGINIFCSCGGGAKTTAKVAGSITMLIIMFVVTVALAVIDSQEWQGAFFGLTMASVVVINMCCGVYQNCLYGMAGSFPMKYTNAVILGSNLSGTLTSVIMIISLLASPNIQRAAIWYFIAAIIALCVALDSYFLLPFLKFYKHFTRPAADDDSQKKLVSDQADDSDDISEEITPERPPYLEILRKIWVQLLGVWMTFFTSLVCFPAIQADIQPSDISNPVIPAHLYTPISTFLFFNLFASLGNLATEWIKKPGPRFVIIPIALRLLFIPFFMFCNYRPDDRTLPVFIDNDYAYFAGAIIMAFTSGYFSSLCMMYAPSLVEPKWAGTAAMISAFFLILGIVSGVNFSLVVAKIVESA